MPPQSIVLLNQSTVLTNEQIYVVIPTFQLQLDRDFAPIWNTDATLTLATDPAEIDPSAWQLLICDDSDQADALGYHELTPSGQPLGKVFAKTDLQFQPPLNWTVTASHELLEMLVNPYNNLGSLGYFMDPVTFYAYEICDPCSDEQYGYKIGDILVSDFVFPAWFLPASGAQLDYNHTITKMTQPLTGTPGSTILILELGTPDRTWQKLTFPVPQA